MDILLNIIVSAITSILVLKFFAYKYFEVIDSYVTGLMNDTKKLFENFINSIRDTAGYK